jgi:hypothetical protein
MSGETGWGIGRGVNGNEAAGDAVRQALRQIEMGRPVLGLVFYSQNFNPTQIIDGLQPFLGTTPVWGFSTECPFTSDGEAQRSVLVGLVGGNGLKASVHWAPTAESNESPSALRKGIDEKLADLIARAPGAGGGLMASCGSSNDLASSTAIQRVLLRAAFPMMGSRGSETGLAASGSAANGKSSAPGPGNTPVERLEAEYLAGEDGLAFATLGGRFRMGVGSGSGWQSMGALLRVTKARDEWVLGLNGRTPAEVYGKIFGYPPEDWSFPPLREMARLYPLGVEVDRLEGAPSSAQNGGVIIRTPEWIESNGSFRMSAPIREGNMVSILVGDRKKCIQAGQEAARQALECLNRRGNAHPLLAIVLVDLNWRYLFQNNLKTVMETIQSQVGDVPVLGAYTTGQVVGQGERSGVDFLNGNITVTVIGESES